MNAHDKVRDDALDTAQEAFLALIDSDEFYDMLPGNGEDDNICGVLAKQVKARIAALKKQGCRPSKTS